MLVNLLVSIIGTIFAVERPIFVNTDYFLNKIVRFCRFKRQKRKVKDSMFICTYENGIKVGCHEEDQILL